jgi:hypothetical protein
MLSEPRFGAVVPPRSPESIFEAIRNMGKTEAFTAASRTSRMRLARAWLSADAGARYLLEAMRWTEYGGARPLPYFINDSNNGRAGS